MYYADQEQPVLLLAVQALAAVYLDLDVVHAGVHAAAVQPDLVVVLAGVHAAVHPDLVVVLAGVHAAGYAFPYSLLMFSLVAAA